jgi:ribosomal protein L11 methyltransferase
MSWLELSLTVHGGQQARVESALEDLGALSITLRDADADTPDERAIFEPGVGELPLWNEIVLQALFASDADRAGLLHALQDFVPELAPERITFRPIEDQDWTRVWMDKFQPMRFGERLWIYPSTIEPPADGANAAIVRLDPGLAFGTGTHPTTALCLEWLDALAGSNTDTLAGKTLIDFGCGSGVLAIAALKLDAARAIGVDNDAQALVASRVNAERNGVVEKMDLYPAEHFPPMREDVLIANILAGPLADLAPQFAACLRPGGLLALSGILQGQEIELLARYAQWFDDLQVATRDGWVRISARRKVS